MVRGSLIFAWEVYENCATIGQTRQKKSVGGNITRIMDNSRRDLRLPKSTCVKDRECQASIRVMILLHDQH